MKKYLIGKVFIFLFFCFYVGYVFSQTENVSNTAELNNAVVSSSITIVNVSSDIVLNANISNFPAGSTKTIQGTNASNLWMINGGGTRSGFTMSLGSTSTLNMQDIQVSSMTRTNSGAALYTSSNSVVNIKNSVFNFNKATTALGNGGAIYNANGSTMTITNSSFSNNTAYYYGGAIYNNGGFLTITSTDPVNRTTLFSNNSVTFITDNSMHPGGGAIYSTGAGSLLDISNARFIENGTSNSIYGAVFVDFGGTLNVNNSLFKDNIAKLNGPAIGGGKDTTINIKNSIFDTNISAGSGYSGAVYAAGQLYIDSSTFINNSVSTGYSGAVCLNAWIAGEVFDSAKGEIKNSYFENNSAGVGGAITNGDNGTMHLSNNIFKGNFNTTFSGSGGGAIYNEGYLYVDYGNTFENNSSTGTSGASGGAIFSTTQWLVYVSSMVTVEVEVHISSGNKFISNSAYKGGVIAQNTWQGTSNPSAYGKDVKTFIEGSLFKENKALGGTGNGLGGVIYNFGGKNSDAEALLDIRNSTFTANSATNNGGVIYNYSETGSSATVKINGGLFDLNSAANGGVLYNAGVAGSISSVTIENVVFSTNTATSNGGAIYNTGVNSSVGVTGSSFNGNSAGGSGGAIYNTTNAVLSFGSGNSFIGNKATVSGGAIFNTTNAVLSFGSGNSFIGNQAAVSGGAIYSNSNVAGSTITFDGSVFTNNASLSTSGNNGGGAFYHNASNVFTSITNSIFQTNSAKMYGGAVYFASNGMGYAIAFSTFVGNSAGSGGAIYQGGGKVDNVVFSSNTATFVSGTTGNGGAIYNTASSTITGSAFTTNIASGTSNLSTGLGGAIYNNSALAICDSVFMNNQATAYGGAIYHVVTATTNVLSVTDSAFISNSALNGGALWNNNSANSIINVSSSNFTQNSASSNGGAIYNSGLLNLNYGNTFSSNTAVNGGSIYNTRTINIDTNEFSYNISSSSGGAVYNTGLITIDYSLFANNTATGSGGAIYHVTTSATNILSITDSDFISNSALNGGALWNNNSANSIINVSSVNFIKNSASSSGGAIYNSGTLNLDSEIIFSSNTALSGGAVYNTRTITSNGSLFYNNSATGNGGAIYSSGGTVNINAGVFEGNKSGGNGGAIYNLGVLYLNSFLGNIVFFNNSASGLGNDIYNAASSININGTLNDVVIEGGIAGIGTINKSNDGRLLINGDSSGFTGTLNETGGEIIVSSSGKMFAGTNNVSNNALLNVTGDSYYYSVKLGSTGTLQHYNTDVPLTTVSSSNLSFTGSDAIAYFGTASFASFKSNYLLSTSLGNTNANTVIFENSKVSFGANTYTNGTAYFFNNAVLDLTTSLNNTRTVTFNNLGTSNSELDFTISFNNSTGTGSFSSDKLVTQASTDTVSLRFIKIVNDNLDSGLSGSYSSTVLSGLHFLNSVQSVIATTVYEYAFTTDSDQTGVELTVIKEADEYSLNKINIYSGTRGFNFSFFINQPDIYHLGASLDDTARGSVLVQGYDNDASHSVISGVLKDTTTFQRGSLFNLVDATTLTINNLTIDSAYIATSGSVLRSTNPLAKSNMNNVILSNNAAEANGGALYVLIGTHTFTNVVVTSNTALNGSGGFAFFDASKVLFYGSVPFRYNSAEVDGGAMFLADSMAVFKDAAIFDSNKSGDKGGALYLDNSNVKFSEVIFSNNEAKSGGAIYMTALAMSDINSVEFLNPIFINNHASGVNGGAIYVEGNASLNFKINEFANDKTVWFGNTANGISNFMFLDAKKVGNKIYINFDINDGKFLEIKDSIQTSAGNGFVNIKKTGQGVLKLYGENSIASNGSFTVKEGVLDMTESQRLFLNPNYDTKLIFEKDATFVPFFSTSKTTELSAETVKVEDGVILQVNIIDVVSLKTGKTILENAIVTNNENSYIPGKKSSFSCFNNLIDVYYEENANNLTGKNFDLIINLMALKDAFGFKEAIDCYRNNPNLPNKERKMFEDIYATGGISEDLALELEKLGVELEGSAMMSTRDTLLEHMKTLRGRLDSRLDSFHYGDTIDPFTEYASIGTMATLGHNEGYPQKIWGMYSSRKIEQKAQAEKVEYEYEPKGFTLGYDRFIGEYLVGGALQYDEGELFANDKTLTMKVRGFGGALYGAYDGEKYYANVGLEFGNTTNEENTYYKFLKTEAKGKYDLNYVGANGELGILAKEFESESWCGQIMPHIGLNVGKMYGDGFMEKGDASVTREIRQFDMNVGEIPIGVKFAQKVVFDNSFMSTLIGIIDVNYGFGVGDKETKGEGKFVGGSETWKIKGIESGDVLRVRIGLDIKMLNQYSLGFSYISETKKYYSEQGFDVRLNWEF